MNYNHKAHKVFHEVHKDGVLSLLSHNALWAAMSKKILTIFSIYGISM